MYLFGSSIKDQVERLSQNIKQQYKEENHEENDKRLGGRTRRDGTCDKKEFEKQKETWRRAI